MELRDYRGDYTTYMQLNIAQLHPHPIAQREFNEKRAKDIAKNFSWDKFIAPEVSVRNGKYWVIDGQHRIAALRMAIGDKASIICHVHTNLTEEEEREIFINQKRIVKPLTANEILRVMYLAADKDVCEMVRGATLAGWVVDFKARKRDGCMSQTRTLMMLYQELGAKAYTDMLQCMKAAWNGNKESTVRDILMGMGKFYQVYAGKFDSKDLAADLKKTDPVVVRREGHALVGTSAGRMWMDSIRWGIPFAQVILRAYNKGRRNKLDESLLFAKPEKVDKK